MALVSNRLLILLYGSLRAAYTSDLGDGAVAFGQEAVELVQVDRGEPPAMICGARHGEKQQKHPSKYRENRLGAAYAQER